MELTELMEFKVCLGDQESGVRQVRKDLRDLKENQEMVVETLLELKVIKVLVDTMVNLVHQDFKDLEVTRDIEDLQEYP